MEYFPFAYRCSKGSSSPRGTPRTTPVLLGCVPFYLRQLHAVYVVISDKSRDINSAPTISCLPQTKPTLNSTSICQLFMLMGMRLHSQPFWLGLSCVRRTCLFVF